MVDPGAAQALIKQLNRWYRRRARPRGTMDHFHRGMRMRFTAAYRVVAGLTAGFLLSIAAILCFVPDVTEGKSALVVLLLKLGCGGIVAVAVFMLMQAFREYAVVTDDGLVKSDLFGRESRLAWRDISQFQLKPDDNKAIFRQDARTKLTMSLSYDGWQDFLETAANRLNPGLYRQLRHSLMNVDAKIPVSLATVKARWAKWFRRGR